MRKLPVLQSREEYSLEGILAGFSDEQLRMLFRNMGAIELTRGCSVGCSFCGLEAEKGVRAQMPFAQIEEIVSRFKAELRQSRPSHYHASDPLDWQEGSRTYEDVHKLFESVAGYVPFVSTAVPKGKEELLMRMLMANRISRVSISKMNYNRLKEFMLGQFPELRNPMREGIVDKGYGSNKVALFTDSLNPRFRKIYPNWMDIIHQLVGEENNETSGYVFTDDGRTDNNSVYKLGKRHIGNLTKMGLGCFHGVLLRYDGFYSIEVVPPSEGFPQGISYEKVTPKNFSFWHLWWQPTSTILLPYQPGSFGPPSFMIGGECSALLKPLPFDSVCEQNDNVLAQRVLRFADGALRLPSPEKADAKKAALEYLSGMTNIYSMTLEREDGYSKRINAAFNVISQN